MTNLMSTLKLNTVQVDFTATDTTTLQNYVVDVLSKMSSTGWDSLRESFPALTDSIDSTYGVVSHVNNFIGLNISDTPFQIIKAAFDGSSCIADSCDFLFDTGFKYQVNANGCNSRWR